MGLLNSLFGLLRFNKKNWRAVVLCLLAAMIFWFLNALNKEYTANISFPLQFEFDRKYYIPIEPLPEEISLNVTGLGWDLFRRSAGWNTPPLTIPLEKPAEVKKIVSSTMPALFSTQLQTMQINFVVSDTVYINVGIRSRRWLTLTVDSVEQYLRNEYGLESSVSIRPDSIFVEGPLSIVSELQEPYPIRLEDFDIDDDYEEEVEVKLPELIHRNPPVVQVNFKVEPFIYVNDSVPLELLDIPKNVRQKIGLTKLPVTLRMRESIRRALVWDSVQAVVNLQGFKRGSLDVLPTLKGITPQVEVIRLDSVHISF